MGFEFFSFLLGLGFVFVSLFALGGFVCAGPAWEAPRLSTPYSGVEDREWPRGECRVGAPPGTSGGVPEGRRAGGTAGLSLPPPTRPSKASLPNSVFAVVASCQLPHASCVLARPGFLPEGLSVDLRAHGPRPLARGGWLCCYIWWISRGRWAHLAPFKVAPCGVVDWTTFPYGPTLA